MVYPANRRLSPVAQAFYTETLTIKSKQTVTLT